MKKSIPIIIVVAAVAVGLFLVLGGKEKETASTTNTTNTSTTSSSQPNSSTAQKTFTTAEVATHNKESDCWTFMNGNVYDITSYVPRHPGGVNEITQICGKDGKSLFEGNPEHNSTAKNQLEQLKIGTLN